MQLSHEQLDRHLKQQALSPVYLLHGEIPLLIQECRDAIRFAASQQGFTEHQSFFVDPGFRWEVLHDLTQQLDLFHKKSVIELRDLRASLDSAAMEALSYYLDHLPAHHCLIWVSPKITPAQKKSAWYKKIETAGAVISCYPLVGPQLHRWIAHRLQKINLSADSEAIALLAELTEGNLSATHQAIEKLALIGHTEKVTAPTVLAVLHEQGQFTVFDLAQEILAGSVPRALRILSHLRDTQTPLPLVLWATTRELRALYTLLFESQHGRSLTTLLAAERKPRQMHLKKAVSRLSLKTMPPLFEQAQRIDAIIKGLQAGDAWEALESLIITLSSR